MITIPPIVRRAAGGLALGLMLVTIVSRAFADPATTPREEDRAEAARVLESEGELRVERPEGTWIAGLGIIEPASPARTLGPAVPGRVAEIAVTEGQMVQVGDLLVALDTAAEAAGLAAAEAEIALAELELTRVRGRVRRQDITVLQEEAEGARARAEGSANVLERLQATRGSAGLSADALDRAQQQADSDAAAARAAVARLQSAEDALPLDVRLAQAKLDAAVARHHQAQATLDLRRVVAPIAGEVLEVLPEIGEYVTPGAEGVVVLGDTRTLRARIDIDERDIALLQSGAVAVITVDALPGREFAGKVVSIGRRMGRKNVRTNEPSERLDTKILEVVVELGSHDELVVGQRVTGYLQPAAPPPSN